MNQEVQTRKCSNPNCIQPIKPITEFTKNKSYLDGLSQYCKICKKEKDRIWRTNNHEKKKTIDKLYYINNKEKIKTKQHEKYIKNRKRILKNVKQYNINNKEKINKYRRDYDKKKRLINNEYRIIRNYRKRTWDMLRGVTKSYHTIKLLGCTSVEFRKYLESQFTEGMSWDNYGNKEGQWSIDHIIPCEFFKDYLTDPVEQYMCFRWQNTRPMWHIDNIKKGDKLIP